MRRWRGCEARLFVAQCHLHVLQYGLVGNEIIALEYKAYGMIAVGIRVGGVDPDIIIKKEVATWFMSVSVWRRWYLQRTY